VNQAKILDRTLDKIPDNDVIMQLTRRSQLRRERELSDVIVQLKRRSQLRRESSLTS
jgi:hypothetical protein